jgi:hypothetical protein
VATFLATSPEESKRKSELALAQILQTHHEDVESITPAVERRRTTRLAERKARNIPKASDESKKSVKDFEAFIRNWSGYSAVLSALGIQSPRIYPDAS